MNKIRQVADTETAVLILGETGVGKDLVARAIHRHSRRNNQPFIKVLCNALPEGLITSELFGHEKGAFTGSVQRRIGRFELADGGTIFLDEIGDLQLDVQTRLLQVLQSKEFERVGGTETIRSDFRLVTATNRDLAEAVKNKRFRADLYYRLNVFPIYVPPLRERKEDIPILAYHFLKTYAARMGKTFDGICKRNGKIDAIRLAQKHPRIGGDHRTRHCPVQRSPFSRSGAGRGAARIHEFKGGFYTERTNALISCISLKRQAGGCVAGVEPPSSLICIIQPCSSA